MQDVHNTLLYAIQMWLLLNQEQEEQGYVQQVLNYRRLLALKEKEVFQRSHSSDPVPVHTIRAIAAIYCSTQYIGMLKGIELYCTMSYFNIATY